MAVPVHLFLKDDGGAVIRGGSDVQEREGSVELRGLTHNLSIPTDGATGKLTGTRKHAPFLFDKEIDSSTARISTKLSPRVRRCKALNSSSIILMMLVRKWNTSIFCWKV